jgi:hypothetical protein
MIMYDRTSTLKHCLYSNLPVRPLRRPTLGRRYRRTKGGRCRAFRETFELLRNHIGQSADKMEVRLSANFERELMYILLYLFTTLLFISSRDQDAGSQSDQLTKWSLTELARRDGAQIGALLQEYRRRFDHFRKIKLFVSTDRVLMNEGSLQLGRYLTGQDSVLFGTIVQGLFAAVINSLREEMTP